MNKKLAKYKITYLFCVLTLSLHVFAIGITMSMAAPKDTSYWFNRAFREPNLDKKIEYYIKASRLDPNDPDIHNNLGIIYKKKGRYEKAVKSYQKALATPNYKTPEYAYHNLGLLYRDRAMYDKAVIYFNKAITANSQFIKSYNALGLTYKIMGRYEDAIANFKKALDINPGYIQASYNLENVWKLSEEDTVAKQKAERLFDEGVALLKKQQAKAAADKFQEVLKLDPQHPGANEQIEIANKKIQFNKLYNKGRNFMARKRWKDAISYLGLARGFATTRAEKQKISAREQEIQRTINVQSQKNTENKLYHEGLLSLKKEDWLTAISKFTKILMLNPNHKLAQEKNDLAKISYYYAKGIELVNTQKWNDAEEKFKDVIRIDSEHAGAKEQLKIISEHRFNEKINLFMQQAEQAKNLDDFKTATALYQNVLKLDSEHEQAKIGLAQLKKLGGKVSAWGKIINYVLNPVKLISLLIIFVAAYFMFTKLIIPSQIITHYLKYKEYDKTRIIYEKILEKDTDRRGIYPALANIYIQLKRPDGVEFLIQICQQKIQNSNRSEAPLWHLCLGEILQEEGQLDEAQQEMELAYKKQPSN